MLGRIRRNHALEHATINLLSMRYPHLQLVGRSDWTGFTIYGEVDSETVVAAAQEALARLQRGERELAIHPRCGTNLATMGIMAGLSAFLAMLDRPKRRLSRLPRVLLAATIGVIIAQPLSFLVQERLTTSADVQGMRIEKIVRQRIGRILIHKVYTAWG